MLRYPRYLAIFYLFLTAMLLPCPTAFAGDWIRGGDDGKQPLWGIRSHLQFAIPPASRGPLGLVRILYPTLPDGKYDLVNFIAIEPIVKGTKGFSELEHSRLDNVQGKRFWVEQDETAGELSRLPDGRERLQVVIHVEPFDNGAHVRLIIEQFSDSPDEIAMSLQAEADSAPIEYGILTATMGNKARARQLWLKDAVVSSLKLYPDYRGPDFAPHTIYPLNKLTVTKEGDLLAAITTDERQPANVHPFPGSDRWYYGGIPVTQYWKMKKGSWRDDVHVAVNARHTYWKSEQPIPGGIAFENFELRERYHPDQRFIFGMTRRTPADLGILINEPRPLGSGRPPTTTNAPFIPSSSLSP